MLDESLLQALNSIGFAMIAIAIFYLLAYYIQLGGRNSRTEKYRFASKGESSALQMSSNLLSIGITFFAFVLISHAVGLVETYLYYFVGFFSVLIGIAFGYGFGVYLKFYYPFILEKRLHNMRFAPMVSPHNGNKMVLLNEEQEDVHLSKEMIEEEDSLTVDFDVWIDEETGYKVIEKYDTHYHALVCDNCNFRTLKEKKEEVLKEPTNDLEGTLLKYYECSYCGNHEKKEVNIPSLSEKRKMENLEKVTP